MSRWHFFWSIAKTLGMSGWSSWKTIILQEAKQGIIDSLPDTDAAIRAINSVQVDHYLMKP